MKSKLTRLDTRIFILAIAALCLHIFLFRQVYPESAIQIKLSKQEIQRHGEKIIHDIGFDVKGTRMRIDLQRNKDLTEHIQKSYGTRGAALLRDSVSAFYWEMSWINNNADDDENPDTISVTLGESMSDEKRQYKLILNLEGSPTEGEFTVISQDSLSRPDEMPVEMQLHQDSVLAVQFFQQWIQGKSGWSLHDFEPTRTRKGMVQRFVWLCDHQSAGLKEYAYVDVQYGQIAGFKKQMEIPGPKRNQKLDEVFQIVNFLLLYFFFVVLSIVLLIKRLRADKLDLMAGLLPSILVILSWMVFLLGHMYRQTVWEATLGFIVLIPFMGSAIWVLFILGESYTREVWPEKIRVYDELRRRLITPRIGVSILRGIGFGWIFLGLYTMLNWSGVNWLDGFIYYGDDYFDYWTSICPSLFVLTGHLSSSIFSIVTLCMFFLSLMRARIRRRWMLYLILGFFFMLAKPGLPISHPLWLGLIISFLLGMFYVALFIRYELITVIFAKLSAATTYFMLMFINQTLPGYFLHGFILMSILCAGVIWSLWALRKKSVHLVENDFIPEYIHRIYERERLQRELEIARNVQLNFLPSKNPEVTGLDIATFCSPAREVGGDYFDFIQFGPKKIGVVIGDVSGKGIPAAFYMTLTKGLFKAQAANMDSPREVLIHLNRLFFENAKQGIFISMIYSIFDLESCTMTFARAGHNPMILRRKPDNEAKEICPPGIALGLEQGIIFEKSIAEKTIEIQEGDVYLFYTDGLNEAQNRSQQEYGEWRLKEAIYRYHQSSASEILQQIRDEIATFTGDADQHDDMTAMIIKIKQL